MENLELNNKAPNPEEMLSWLESKVNEWIFWVEDFCENFLSSLDDEKTTEFVSYVLWPITQDNLDNNRNYTETV